MTDAPLHAVLYSSGASHALTRSDLERITDAAVRWNDENDVTGVLLYGEMPRLPGVPGLFVQWLEGPHAQVEATYERIRRDRRHTDVTVIARGDARTLTGTNARLFPDWAMTTRRLADLPATLYGFLEHVRQTA